MGNLVQVLISVAIAVVAVIGLFVGTNAAIDLAPRRFRLFATIVGTVIGGLVGAFANSGGWFIGGIAWPAAGAALGAAIGGLLWGSHPPSLEARTRFVEHSRPVVFLAPACVFLAVTLVIPTIRTLYLSFTSRRSGEFNGLDNYRSIFGDENIFTLSGLGQMFTSNLFLAGITIVLIAGVAVTIRSLTTHRELDLAAPFPAISLSVAVVLVLLAGMGALRAVVWNNFFWVVFVTGASVVFGLAIAVLADRAKGESIAKSLIFMPMAISFVGASVIWRFVYAYTPADSDQIGLLNALWVWFGGAPQTWIQDQPWNNLFLIAIMIWIQTGFAMVVLSASIKAVPSELIEAARVDGASEGQIFWRVTLPQIKSTVVVVVTTLIITVLKVYDIVKVMTNGEFGTEVIANRMFDESFINRDYGRGSALAIVLLVSVVPLMLLNVRRMRKGTAE